MSEKHTRGTNFVQGVCPLPPGISSGPLQAHGDPALAPRHYGAGSGTRGLQDAFSTLTEQKAFPIKLLEPFNRS